MTRDEAVALAIRKNKRFGLLVSRLMRWDSSLTLKELHQKLDMWPENCCAMAKQYGLKYQYVNSNKNRTIYSKPVEVV